MSWGFFLFFFVACLIQFQKIFPFLSQIWYIFACRVVVTTIHAVIRVRDKLCVCGGVRVRECWCTCIWQRQSVRHVYTFIFCICMHYKTCLAIQNYSVLLNVHIFLMHIWCVIILFCMYVCVCRKACLGRKNLFCVQRVRHKTNTHTHTYAHAHMYVGLFVVVFSFLCGARSHAKGKKKLWEFYVFFYMYVCMYICVVVCIFVL